MKKEKNQKFEKNQNWKNWLKWQNGSWKEAIILICVNENILEKLKTLIKDIY